MAKCEMCSKEILNDVSIHSNILKGYVCKPCLELCISFYSKYDLIINSLNDLINKTSIYTSK
jgi:hypothetical protein